MRLTSRYLSVSLLAFAALAQAAGSSSARWQARGSGVGREAVWTAGNGEPRAWLRCDRGDPVLVLRIAPSVLPQEVDQVILGADGTEMDYPATRGPAPGLASRIALDAPILDRMLVAQRFTISAGGRTLATGSPGTALARVVRACRALHWPREARIDPNEAGLAKK
jgi:hypothetical protein